LVSGQRVLPMRPGVVLMVAAEAVEFSGLREHFETKPLEWGLQFTHETELNGKRVVLVAHGAGMRMAGAAADVARRKVDPEAVVSTGYCGALDPELAAGDVFAASALIDQDHGRTYSCVEPDFPDCRRGTLVSVDRFASTAAEKRALRETGADVVEMEAAAVAERAHAWSVPFYCIRSVSDSAGESFGIDFNRMRDDDGRFSRPRIVAAVLVRPWSRVPALMRLNGNCRKASKSLGEFLAKCRF
jgi:adenosylhomocysteine nucleosidase